MNNIKETIRQLAQGGRQSVSLVCTVDAVDKTARTVDCTPLDESAPLLGVNLQANQESTFGVVAFPKVGSYVVVGFVADGAAGVVLLTDEVESVEVVISGDTARISAGKDGVRLLMGDDRGHNAERWLLWRHGQGRTTDRTYQRHRAGHQRPEKRVFWVGGRPAGRRCGLVRRRCRMERDPA